MLEKIRQDDEAFIQKTMENFGVSVTTVKRYLRECLENHILRKDKNVKTQYILNTTTHFFLIKLKSVWGKIEFIMKI